MGTPSLEIKLLEQKEFSKEEILNLLYKETIENLKSIGFLKFDGKNIHMC